MSKCKHCGRDNPAQGGYKPRETCSDACRTAYSRSKKAAQTRGTAKRKVRQETIDATELMLDCRSSGVRRRIRSAWTRSGAFSARTGRPLSQCTLIGGDRFAWKAEPFARYCGGRCRRNAGLLAVWASTG